MQSSVDIISNMSNKIIENPQTQETRCRICYQDAKPLITLCQCSGTIAYVHQDCILDWITKKMEVSDAVEIPKCEICRAIYSAKLKIGNKKVCYKALCKKIKELKFIQMFASLLYLLGTIIAFFVSSKMVFYLFALLFTSAQRINNDNDSLMVDVFTRLIFPYYFVRAAFQHAKKRGKLWSQSMVQIVQLTLNPKLTIKK